MPNTFSPLWLKAGQPLPVTRPCPADGPALDRLPLDMGPLSSPPGIAGWQLLHGAMRLTPFRPPPRAASRPPTPGQPELASNDWSDPASAAGLVMLALPGDWVGLEHGLGLRARLNALALTHCWLAPLPASDDPRVQRLRLAQLHEQMVDRAGRMSSLQRGRIPQRLQRLTRLLADHGTAHEPLTLWHLRGCDVAELLDTSPETVSRLSGGDRRTGAPQAASNLSITCPVA